MATRSDLPPASDEAFPDDEKETLADGDWPVPEQYRVDADRGEAMVVREASPLRTPRRRFPLDLSPGLLAVLLGALLLIPGGVLAASYVSDDDGQRAEAADTMGATSLPHATGTTETAPAAGAGRLVPDVVGLLLADARAQLEARGFEVRARAQASEAPKGDVLEQAPPADTRVQPGTVIALTISSGIADLTVPDVVGASAREAARILRQADLRPVYRSVRSEQPVGTVLAQRPAAGAPAEAGTAVRLDVVKAPSPQSVAIDVPDLRGLDVEAARADLRELGLRSTVTRVPSDEPTGMVVGQSPRPGSAAREGQVVSLRVSSGPDRVVVPDVTGLDEQTARQELEAAGFVVAVVDEATSDPAQDGLVASQDPRSGASVEKGSRVTLTVARLG